MEKAQEQLYRMIENHFYYVVEKLPLRQDGLFKTYLWSASLILALNFSLLKDHPFFWPLPFWKCSALISIACAFVVLAFCIDSLRGRSDQQMEFPDYQCYLDDMNTYDPASVMVTVANDLKKKIIRQSKEQTKRAEKLRTSSKGLILSFAFLAIAGVAYILT